MEKTFVRQVKYRGELFSDRTFKSEWQNYSFFWLEEFSFFFVETDTNDTPFQLRHGDIWGFTKNKRRKIKMSFTAIAYSEIERWNIIKKVNTLFSPPLNPNLTDKRGYYPMEFTTVDWMVREFQAKVIKRPQDKDEWNIHTISFDVELISDGWSCIYWKIPYELTERNFVRGVSLPASLPFAFSDYPASVVNYVWVSDSYAKCTITALQDEATIWTIQIMSLRPWSFTRMYFSLDLNEWDVLAIDPYNYLVELNGVDITWSLELDFGNNFPILQTWVAEQKLVVDTWKPTKTCDVLRERKDTRC